MMRRALLLMIGMLASSEVAAQQRPLTTEDPEPIGAGRMLIEGGLDLADDQQYPVSGLRGNLVRLPSIGLSFGISSIAEFQVDGSFYTRLAIDARDPQAPLAPLVNIDGDTTSDIDDIVIATKLRVLSERANRPSFALRFATKLPNASNESGLGLDTTDFLATLLTAKTVQSVRVVGNVGVGILADPTSGNRQNDVLTYGVSLARALTDQVEVVGEINGRAHMRSAPAFPGTESRSTLRVGTRYTRTAVRLDAGIAFGLSTLDPTVGLTAGLTYVFRAFEVP
jgi:hypothetical protein